MEHFDKNGVKLEVGSIVLVPEPNETDVHQHGFSGSIVSFRNGNAVVEDSDDDAFEIEPERLSTDY